MEGTLNLYHIFQAVARSGNISQAAKELYISQPAVSKSISRLEELLNTTLFYRSSRGVSLTEEGALLQEQIQKAFDSIAYGEEQLRKINELGIGQITIGVSTTLCKYVLLPYLQRFIRENPHIRVSIACQPTMETVSNLQNGSIDIGLIGDVPDKKNLHFQPVMEIQDEFVTTRRYLQNLSTRLGVTITQLYENNNSLLWSNGTFLLLNEENISRRYINSYLFGEKIEITQAIEISTMDLLIEFARIDMGIACVIGNFVEKEIEENALIKLPLAVPIPGRNIGFARKIQADYPIAVRKFCAMLSPGFI